MTRTVRPTREAIRRVRFSNIAVGLFGAAFLLLMGGLSLLPLHPDAQPYIFLGLAPVFLAITMGYVIWWTRSCRVEYGDGRYTYVSLFRRREFTAADVRFGALTPALRQGLALTAPALCLAAVDGRRVVRQLSGLVFPAAELPLLASDLIAHGAEVREFAPDVTAADLRTIDRGLATWRMAHPGAFMGIFVAAALAVMIVFLVVVVVLFASR